MSELERIIQLYPLVPIALGLIVGIVVGENFEFSYSILLTMMLAIIALAMLFNSVRRLGGLVSLGYPVLFLLIGVFLTKWNDDRQSFSETDSYETFYAIVVSDPMERDDGVRAEVMPVDGRMEGKAIRLYIKSEDKSSTSKIQPGQCLKVKAKVRHPKNFANSRFDYPLYLKSHGIVATATAYSGNWHVINNHGYSLSPLDNIKIYTLGLRRAMVEKLRLLDMDDQAFAVVAAMSLGDKSEVSKVTSNVYSLAGTSHVLALSGLHLSIVFGLFAVFGGRWRRSVAMVVSSVVAIWIYVLLAGSPVSMIRAAIMLSVSLLVGLSGRNGVTLNTLSFSAMLILLANPFAIHDIGFQLSFAAVAFLGTFASGICQLLPTPFLFRHRFLRWCWQMVVTSTVAQLGTTPLVAYHFGRLPLLFLPANFIAIPAATAMLYLSVAFFLLLWLPMASHIVGYALSITSSLLNDSMTWIASLGWSSLMIENVRIIDVVSMYVIAIVVLSLLKSLGRVKRVHKRE